MTDTELIDVIARNGWRVEPGRDVWYVYAARDFNNGRRGLFHIIATDANLRVAIAAAAARHDK